MTEWKANQLFSFFNKSKISNLLLGFSSCKQASIVQPWRIPDLLKEINLEKSLNDL